MTETKYGIHDMFGDKRCPLCNSTVILIWGAKGKTFECTKCKNELSKEPYPVVSSSDEVKER